MYPISPVLSTLSKSNLEGISVTKETSYVTAIGSAAIVHQIARACADGNIRSCGCGVNNEYSTYFVILPYFVSFCEIS